MPSVEDRRVLEVPLERAWKMAKKSHELLPQLMPEVFESIELEEGDGGPGSIFVLTTGPAMPGGRGRVVKERVDVRDDERHKLKHTTIAGGDPRYSRFTATLRYERGPHRDSTVRTWTAKYTPAPGQPAAPPPDAMRRLSERITATLHAFAAQNPDYCAS